MAIAAAGVSVLALFQSAAADFARQEEARLKACVAKIETRPEEAYEDGLAWTSEGNRPGARQCTALALVALGHHETGATRLEALARASDGGTLEQRAVYLAQAGHAWLQAGALEAAITSFSDALRLAPDRPELLIDRAGTFMMLERWDEALADLNAAIAVVPGDGEALQLRAEVHLAKDSLDLAERDVRAALAADPRNIQTLVTRGRVREARRLATERR